MTLRSALVVWFSLALGMAGRNAYAGDNALVIVERVDQAESAALELVKATAQKELETKAWAVTEAFTAKMTAPQTSALAACMRAGDSQCIARALQSAPDLTHVLVIHVKARGPIDGSTRYSLEAQLAPRSGQPIRTAARYCDNCSAASLETFSAEVTNEVLLDSAGTGRLDLKSDPSGATVFVDGEPLGVTPLVIQVRVGNHLVSFSKEGYAPVADVKVAVETGGLVPVSRTLAPIGGDDHNVKPALAIPISLMALGTAALGVGVYFIVTGGEAGQGETQPETLMRTPGFVIAGTGALVAGIGTYLLLRQLRKAPEREPAVSFDGGVGPGGVYVGARIRY